MSNWKAYLSDAKKELKKVHWPNKPTVVETSMIVVGCAAVFAGFLWLVDLGLLQLFRLFLYKN